MVVEAGKASEGPSAGASQRLQGVATRGQVQVATGSRDGESARSRARDYEGRKCKHGHLGRTGDIVL